MYVAIVQGRIQEIEFGGVQAVFTGADAGLGIRAQQTALKIFSHCAHYTCRFHVLV